MNPMNMYTPQMSTAEVRSLVDKIRDSARQEGRDDGAREVAEVVLEHIRPRPFDGRDELMGFLAKYSSRERTKLSGGDEVEQLYDGSGTAWLSRNKGVRVRSSDWLSVLNTGDTGEDFDAVKALASRSHRVTR